LSTELLLYIGAERLCRIRPERLPTPRLPSVSFAKPVASDELFSKCDDIVAVEQAS